MEPTVSLVNEPFHRLRNKIINDLKGTWISSVYWHNFRDKDLLRAVITRMQTKGDLLCRSNGNGYEWSVPVSVKLSKFTDHSGLR